MSQSSKVSLPSVFVLFSVLLLTSCGGGGGGNSSDQALFDSQLAPQSDSQIFIAGAGVKGPLAFANVELYALDSRFGQLYEPGNPIASSTTDAYAEISGLAVPGNIDPPYVLVINGANAIDRNTDQTPVIKKLITIITQESLDAGEPVYATPYTTLAYHMLKYDYDVAVSAVRVSDPFIGDAMAGFNQQIIESASFGLPPEVNIFSTPPIVTGSTITLEQQQLVVNYRAAIEALSSLVYETSLASSDDSADMILRKLALDLYNDGTIDGWPSGIDTQFIFRDPMTVDIANTQYLVQDIVSLMDEERALTGSAGDVLFLKDSVSVNLQYINVAYEEPVQLSKDNVDPVPDSSGVKSASSSGETVLHVDFENRAVGRYKEADLRKDFQVGQQGYNDSVHGPDWNSTIIANDPAGSGRGKVLRVTRTKGRAGSSAKSGGMRFRADVPPADEYYFSYDTFVPSSEVGGYDFWWPLQEKQPALINGTLRDASHATGSSPEVDGITGFNSRTQFLGHNVYGRGEGTGETKPIDAYDYLPEYFWDIVDPKAGATNKANGFQHPRGRWIRIEQRVKMNTADAKKSDNPSVDLKDGKIEVWVTDEAIGWYGKKVLTESFKFRFVNTMKIDGIFMYDHYGGRYDEPKNKPPQNQSRYYDNFIVSPLPITH